MNDFLCLPFFSGARTSKNTNENQNPKAQHRKPNMTRENLQAEQENLAYTTVWSTVFKPLIPIQKDQVNQVKHQASKQIKWSDSVEATNEIFLSVESTNEIFLPSVDQRIYFY